MNSLNQAITQHPFFQGMTPQHLALLLEGATIVEFKAGEVLFREREPANKSAGAPMSPRMNIP